MKPNKALEWSDWVLKNFKVTEEFVMVPKIPMVWDGMWYQLDWNKNGV